MALNDSDGSGAAVEFAAGAIAAGKRVRFKVGEGIIGQVIQSGKPMVVPRVSRDAIDEFMEVAQGRMKKKVLGAKEALEGGVSRVVIERHIDAELALLTAREILVLRGDGRFPGEEEYGFRHALVREAAYAALTEEDRADRLAALSLYLAHALEQLRAAATKYLEAPVVVP
mgnify:CR=1 FL=1